MATAERIEKIIDGILVREGSHYTNHPADRGGPTKYGITLGRLQTERGKHKTADDVRALTEEGAREIYRDAYFKRPGIDKLPDSIVEFAMDFYTTSGTWMTQRLQMLLNDLGFNLRVDGVIGAATADAARRAVDTMGDDFLRALIVERTHFFGRIVANDGSQRVFLRGWVNQRSHKFWKEAA